MKSKIPPVRVPSDDCEVKDGDGKPHRIHDGEWIEVVRVNTIRQYLGIATLNTTGKLLQDANIPEEEKMVELAKLEGTFDAMCDDIAAHITGWNWTDLTGQPLPHPYRNKELIMSLSIEEIIWLRRAIQGETPGERKNASRPSTGT